MKLIATLLFVLAFHADIAVAQIAPNGVAIEQPAAPTVATDPTSDLAAPPPPLAVSNQQPAGYMDAAYIADKGAWDAFVQMAPHWIVAMVPMLIAIMVIFRAAAEALLALSRVLGAKEELSKVAEIVLRIADMLARILGQVGVGMPKQLVLERADKIQQKEEAKAATEKPADGKTA